MFLKITKVSEEEPMIFQSYSNTSEYFLRDYVARAMVIFRLAKITCYFMLFSHVKYHVISRVKICLHAKAHLVFHWCLYNKVVYTVKNQEYFPCRAK